MSQQAQVMIVAPHADDAEFGIAGTVAKWAREGREIVYVICTNGDKGSGDPDISPVELVKIREQEQKEAARLLGVKEVVFLGYPDQGLEDTPEFRKEIVRQIRIYRPDIVATSDPYRRYLSHRDHRIAGQVVLDAAYPFARDHLAYPDLFHAGYLPHKVKEVLTWGAEDPNHWSDITDTFDTKIAALFCHKSQVAGRDLAQLRERVKERAAQAAKGRGFELAEEFHRLEIRM